MNRFEHEARQKFVGVHERVRIALVRWHRATGGYEPGRPSLGVARVGLRLKAAKRALGAYRDLAFAVSMRVDDKDADLKNLRDEVKVWEQRVKNLAMESKMRRKEHEAALMRNMSREQLAAFKARQAVKAAAQVGA